MSNCSCHCLIDGQLTNQIALLLPVRGRTEFNKMFGIKGRWFLSSPPPPPSYSPPPYFSPIFWLTPDMLLCSPAFCSLVRSPRRLKGKESAAKQARQFLSSRVIGVFSRCYTGSYVAKVCEFWSSLPRFRDIYSCRRDMFYFVYHIYYDDSFTFTVRIVNCIQK